jgi:hypothetical protein
MGSFHMVGNASPVRGRLEVEAARALALLALQLFSAFKSTRVSPKGNKKCATPPIEKFPLRVPPRAYIGEAMLYSKNKVNILSPGEIHVFPIEGADVAPVHGRAGVRSDGGDLFDGFAVRDAGDMHQGGGLLHAAESAKNTLSLDGDRIDVWTRHLKELKNPSTRLI